MTQPTLRIHFILFFFLAYPLSWSQNQPVGARSAALGNASVTLIDVWGAYNNQSATGWLQHIECGAYYENRFILPELSSQGLAVVVPVKKAGSFGFNFTRFGYTQYNENKFGFSYARKFGPIFSAGLQINLHWIHIGQGYGDLITATGELSFTVKPLPKWIIAAHVFNPTRTPLAEYDREKIPTLFRIGTSYAFHEKVLACTEIEASIHDTPIFRMGVEYHVIPILNLRAGFSSYPVSPSFGFGLHIKNFKLDAAASWQPILGFSPQASLSYAFGK